jgi:hypothetical protein
VPKKRSPGRPPKKNRKAVRREGHPVQVWYLDAEYALLVRAAKLAKMPVAEYVRGATGLAVRNTLVIHSRKATP